MRTRTEECKHFVSLCCSRCTQHSWLSRVMKRMTLSEETTEITTELIDRTRNGQCQTLSSFCSRCTQCLRTSRVAKRTTLFPTRGRTLGGVATTAEEIRSYNRREEEKPSSHYRFSGTMLTSGTPASVGIGGAGETPDSQFQSHSRMHAGKSCRTWRSSLVFKIRDSKPSDTGLREHSEVGAANSLSLSSVEG